MVWGVVGIVYAVPKIKEIKREYLKSPDYLQKSMNRPIPDTIYMLPNLQQTPAEKIKYEYDDEGRAQAAAHALKINKRSGVYYWDSNGGRPLNVATEVRHDSMHARARKATIFTAQDGSGSIVIWHDNHITRGWCGRHGQLSSRYQEKRHNEGRIFYGSSRFFPDRPENWCQMYDDRLRAEGLEPWMSY